MAAQTVDAQHPIEVSGVLQAAKDGLFAQFAPLLKSQAHLSFEDFNSLPPGRKFGVQHQIAFHGNRAALEALLTVHPRVDLKMLNKDGNTAEEVAVEEGADAPFLGFLRECLRRQSMQELVSAARDGDWERFHALLASSGVGAAELNTVPSGRTWGVIHQVSFWGEEGVLLSLVAAHPTLDLELETNEDAPQKKTPLDIAQRCGHTAYRTTLRGLLARSSGGSSSDGGGGSSSAVHAASAAMKSGGEEGDDKDAGQALLDTPQPTLDDEHATTAVTCTTLYQYTLSTSVTPRRQSGDDTAAPPASRALEDLERLTLDSSVCDVARLPAAVAAQVLECAAPLHLLCGVVLEALSDRGVRVRGTPDALCEARRALCAMAKEELGAALSVHRLVTERCRLLATSPAEHARAQQQWRGRRVLHKGTGALLFVRELRVFPGSAPRIELACGAMPADVVASAAEGGDQRRGLGAGGKAEEDPEVLVAGEDAVAWDDFASPDAVKLCVPMLGSDDLVAAFARRACAHICPIEAVRVAPAPSPPPPGPARRFVTVVFDVTADPLAPARAVAQLHGLVVGATKFRLSASVSLPARPVRLAVQAPTALRLRGRFEADVITAAFAPDNVAKVTVPATSATGTAMTTVHFVSAAAALAARRALPPLFSAPGVATLDLKPTAHLMCEDVPLAVKPGALLAQLLQIVPLAQPAPAEDSPDEEDSVGAVGAGVKTSTRPCGPGTKTLVFSFPHLSQFPTLIAQAAPVYTLQGADAQAAETSTRTGAQLTTLALLHLLESEAGVERALASGEESTSDDESTSSLQFSSASSQAAAALAPTIPYGEALDRLGKLAARFVLQGQQDHELFEELNVIISGLFPHPPTRGVCTRHSAFELGAVPQPCCFGMACTYGHTLKWCRDGAGCSKPKCTFVHPTQLADVLRLDTRLHEHCKTASAGGGGVPAALDLASILKALQTHRAAMLRDGDDLIVQHTKRAEEAEAQVLAEQEREPQNGAEAAEKASCVAALQGRAREVRKQIAEFSLARAAFLEADAESFAAARVFAREVYNRFKTCLPIYAERATILAAVQPDFCVLVLIAETGSGKSTQVVQYLSEKIRGRVVCSQPRRLAADTLAERVAAEMMTTKQDGAALVSCKGGGADERGTRIQFCTDFGLLNALYKDPTLAGVGAVVVDEVHERSVATDLLVALLRRTLALRAAAGKHPFRLILTSATMNEALFAGYFARKQWDAASPEDGTCAPVLKVGGRTFPVSVHYDSAASSPGQHEKAAEAKALELHARLPASDYAARAMHDILVFQTAPDECERVAKALAERLPDARCVPLHGGLDKDEQREAFEPVDTARYKRKIVVATNIAEASVTIDGIGVVIDPGVSKQARYDPAKDATVLRVAPVSQASARQRAGRAGRTAPGICFRLYTKEEFEDFDQDSTAELLRADATEAILAVLRQLERQTDWITDVRDFPFVEHPGEARLERALQQLLHLGALTSAEKGSSSKLTPQGSRMARMRCSPRTAAILFAAQRKGVVVAVAVALGCVPTTVSLFLRGRTEEEKATAERQRKELGARFPELGDIGVGVAVWFDTRELSGPEVITWCKERGVSVRAVRECGKQIGQLLSAGTALQHDSAGGGGADEEEAAPTKSSLVALTPADFQGAKLEELRAALLAGYFSSLAFALPRRPSDGEDVPVSYFLPHSSQIALPGKGSACRSTGAYPPVVAYMEVVDTHRVFLSNCFGVGDTGALSKKLPPSYSASPAFAAIAAANDQRQTMSEYSAVCTPCPAALKRLLGPGSSQLDVLREAAREAAGVPADAALVLEADVFKSQLLVACSQPEGRQRVAAHLQAEVDLIARRLSRRQREWALPGTGVRGVMGSGAQCNEVLLRPRQSICLRFVALDITQRLSEPVVAINLVPAGFFRSLADPTVDLATLNVDGALGHASPSPCTGCAQRAVASIDDLRAVPLPAVVAAIEYTAGGVACYGVNSLLRALNENALRAYEPYIRAVNGFHRLRSGHPRNASRSETLLYRGTTIPCADLTANYKPGCTVVWPAFTSTSRSVHVAEMFGGMGFLGGGGMTSVLFEITSSFCCPLKDISVYPGEDEVLLPAFCCFQVVAVLPWKGGSTQKVILRHDPSLATVIPPPPEHAVEQDELARMRQTGTGPWVLAPKSTKKGLVGVTEDVEAQLRVFDADADVEVRTDTTTGRVWGRAWFGSSAQAAQAMKMLNGSQLGTRELQVQPVPCDTDLLQLRCRVFATLTAVPHKGTFVCSCGTRLADEIMAKAHQNAFHDNKAKKMRAQLYLSLEPNAPQARVWVEPHAAVKGEPPIPGTLRLLRVPTSVTLSGLHRELLTLFPQLPVSSLLPPARDRDACEHEAKALRQQGLKGTRERLAFVKSLAGATEGAEETGISYGATYTLWFASLEAARAAAMALDGHVMPGTGLRAEAVAESSKEVLFQPEVLSVVETDINAAVDRIRGTAEAVGGLTLKQRFLGGAKKNGAEKGKGKGKGEDAKRGALSITVSGTNGVAIANAHRELEALQRGVFIAITSPVPQACAAQRDKVFPSPRYEPVRAAAVAGFLQRIAEEHKCLVKPLFGTNSLRVVGPTGAAAAVGAKVAVFLAETPFQANFRVPGNRAKAVQDFVSSEAGQVALGAATVAVEAGGVTRLKCHDAEVFVKARDELLTFLATLSARTARECCVCFEPVRKPLQTCGHITMCEACTATNIRSMCSERQFPICCSEPGCQKALFSQDLAALADDVDALHAASLAHFVLRNRETLGYCATPDCRQILDRTLPSETCGVCQRTQCTRCGEDPHGGETCAEAAARVAFLASPDGAASTVASKLTTNFLCPICPNCGVAFMDFTGCFALTCVSCGSGLCGFCLKDCGGDAHQHTFSCPWYANWKGNQPGYHGGPGHTGGAMGLFQACMRRRLPEMAAEHLKHALPEPDLRRFAAHKALPLMKESEWFDSKWFWELMGYQPY